MSQLIERTLQVLAKKGSIGLEEFQGLVKEAAGDDSPVRPECVPIGWQQHFVPFVRHEGMQGATTVAMLTAWSALQVEEIVPAVKRALTKWVISTEAGRKAWSATCEDFNVGDLMSGSWLHDDALRTLLHAEEVHIEGGVIADATQACNFDHVLVDASDPGVQAVLQED